MGKIQENGKEKFPLGQGEKTQEEKTHLGLALWGRWKSLLDLSCSTEMCGANAVLKQEGSSRSTAEEGGTGLLSPRPWGARTGLPKEPSCFVLALVPQISGTSAALRQQDFTGINCS